jgi:hypothetical protein
VRQILELARTEAAAVVRAAQRRAAGVLDQAAEARRRTAARLRAIDVVLARAEDVLAEEPPIADRDPVGPERSPASPGRVGAIRRSGRADLRTAPKWPARRSTAHDRSPPRVPAHVGWTFLGLSLLEAMHLAIRGKWKHRREGNRTIMGSPAAAR